MILVRLHKVFLTLPFQIRNEALRPALSFKRDCGPTLPITTSAASNRFNLDIPIEFFNFYLPEFIMTTLI